MTRRRPALPLLMLAVAVVALQLVLPVALRTSTAHAAGNGTVALSVVSGATVTDTAGHVVSVAAGAPVGDFKWLITADDVGNPTQSTADCLPARAPGGGRDDYADGESGQPAFADGNDARPASPSPCQWPSVRYTPGSIPVVATGDQSDAAAISLPEGDYLVSTTSDGFRIDGEHFHVTGGAASTVTVTMQPDPLPLGTIRLRVFKDTAPVDGTYEVGVEQPLSGFTVHITDVLDEVTTDWFGNRLCTNYLHYGVGSGPAADAAHPAGYMVYEGGAPVVDEANPGGSCKSDAQGDVVIPNLGSDRYAASLVSPTGEQWYQTTTLEGSHDWDIWTQEGDTGLDTEQTVGGEQVPAVDMGFVPYGPRKASGTQPRDAAPPAFAATNSGQITGTVVEINTYVGGTGGVVVPNAGVAGANVRGPVSRPIVTLSDLDNNDQMVYVNRFGTDGKFQIDHVPDGNYQLTAWDFEQNVIIDSFNVTVNNGEHVDVGQKGLVDWFTEIKGSVFIDANGNGKRDAGEVGVPKFTLALKERDNSVLDQGQKLAQTDDQGNYLFRQAYPLSRWIILEAFNTRYKTTGVTVQADNEPTPRTYLGAGVDINLLPIIGLSGRVDWGVQPYVGAENGGIVGTVTYDSTRNELNPKYALTEDYQPGIPGMTVHLYAPIDCTDGSAPPEYAPNAVCNQDDGYWYFAPDDPQKGAIVVRSTGNTTDGWTPLDLTDPYTTETWDAPKGCTARMYDGTELTGQLALPPSGEAANHQCVDAPMTGWYARPADTTDGAFGQTVNGNYGFGTTNFDPTTGDPIAADSPLPNGDYVVKVDLPEVDGKPLYKPTQEEDVNVFSGNDYLPPENHGHPVYEPDSGISISHSCDTGGFEVTVPAGTFTVSRTGASDVTVTGPGTTTYPVAENTTVTLTVSQGGVDLASDSWARNCVSPGPISQDTGLQWASCVGSLHTVHVTSPGLLDAGGSPFEGDSTPTCESKLVTLRGGQSVAPNFTLFSDVPLPTHFWGLTINDLALSNDRTQVGYGEAQPLPGVPMGIYDFTGRLIDTVTTDYNGMYEAIEPSTSTYNCPLPAGPCPGMYRFVGNDPGSPGHVNQNYNPRFRTIATNFQAWPGLFTVTDTAPTQVGVVAIAPGATQAKPVDCGVNAGVTAASQLTPDLFSVNRPYANRSEATSTGTVFTLRGSGFGASAGAVRLQVSSSSSVAQPVVSWSNDTIRFRLSTSLPTNGGAWPLSVTGANGKTGVNGVVMHVYGNVGTSNRYAPTLLTVNRPTTSPDSGGPSSAANFTDPAGFTVDANTTPEHVVQRALDSAASRNGKELVVVFPNAASSGNPTGDYYENLVMPTSVTLQGVGPGGFTGPTTYVKGSRLNGLGFNADNQQGTDWVAKIAATPHSGPADVPDSAVVTLLGQGTGQGGPNNIDIDGFTITGGAEADNPTAIDSTFGGTTTPVGAPNSLVTQGGGVYLHAGVRNLTVADNVIVGNSGAYGGAIRSGTPYATNASNPNLTVTRNRIRDNGGTNLAGGIALFRGSTAYSVTRNDICGNFSAEYGGGISHYGLSAGGSIANNRIYLNQSYDEGGGVMVAGELNPNLSQPSTGSGAVTIDANLVVDNLANDDGGGIRFLQAGTATINVTNNVVADNVSTHEGGGFALDDSTNVSLVGNTVMKNITTATAATSNGQPAPAGLSTAANSDQLMATFGTSGTTPRYSKPKLQNNVFWDNRAGTWDPATGTVTGIATAGAHVWDMGSLDALALRNGTPDMLAPTFSILTQADPQVLTVANDKVGTDPLVVASYDVSVDVQTSRTFPTFRETTIVANAVAPRMQGDYHLTGSSPALASGSYSTLSVAQTLLYSHDIDGQMRLSLTPDVGADEIP